MGNSNYVAKVDVRPQAPISARQFDAICAKYAKHSTLTTKDARRFLRDLAAAVEADYDEKVADALIAEIDPKKTGKLSLKQFQELFFSSTEAFKLPLSTSMLVKEHRFRRRKPAPPPAAPSSPSPVAPSTEPARRKWVVESRDGTVWNFDPATATTRLLDTIDWKEAKGFNRSEGGTTGVLFVGFDGDEVAVLKGSVTCMADYFANLIGIEAGMPIPRMDLISSASDPNFKVIVSELDRLDSLKKERLRGQHNAMTQMPVMSLIQFVPGTDFYNIDYKTLLGEKSRGSKYRLQQMGRLLAFDVLINNWDRFPVLWDGQGNLGNVFFGKDGKDSEFAVCGIDQCITSITTHDENLQKYLTRVENLLDEAETFETTGSKLLQRLPAVLVQRVGYDIGSFGLRQIWIGLLRGIIDLVDWLVLEEVEGAKPGEGFKTSAKIREWYDDCEELLDELQDFKGSVFDTQGKYGFVRVDIDFLEEILCRFDRRPKLRALLKELKDNKEVFSEL